MDHNIGDKITVTVDGRPYETYIDDQGAQRFPVNPEHPLWDRWKGDESDRHGRGTEDLNQLSVSYQRGEIDQHTYMEFNMSLGYSISGFSELSSFNDLRLINPLWDESEDDEPDDVYILACLCNKKMTLDEAIQSIMRRETISSEGAQEYFCANFLM